MVAVVLSASLLLSGALASVVLARFQAHRAEIVRTVCVQRSKAPAENTCQGRCHLKKKLAEAEQGTGGEKNMPRRITLPETNALAPEQAAHVVLARDPVVFPVLTTTVHRGHRAAPDFVPWG